MMSPEFRALIEQMRAMLNDSGNNSQVQISSDGRNLTITTQPQSNIIPVSRVDDIDAQEGTRNDIIASENSRDVILALRRIDNDIVSMSISLQRALHNLTIIGQASNELQNRETRVEEEEKKEDENDEPVKKQSRIKTEAKDFIRGFGDEIESPYARKIYTHFVDKLLNSRPKAKRKEESEDEVQQDSDNSQSNDVQPLSANETREVREGELIDSRPQPRHEDYVRRITPDDIIEGEYYETHANNARDYSDAIENENDDRVQVEQARHLENIAETMDEFSLKALKLLEEIRDASQSAGDGMFGGDGFDMDFDRRRDRGRGRGNRGGRGARGGRFGRFMSGSRAALASAGSFLSNNIAQPLMNFGRGAGNLVASGGRALLSTGARLGSSALASVGGLGAGTLAAIGGAVAGGGTGLYSLVKAIKGEDSSNWISNAGDALIQKVTGNKDTSLGSWLFDKLHDEKGNNRIAKFFGFGDDDPLEMTTPIHAKTGNKGTVVKDNGTIVKDTGIIKTEAASAAQLETTPARSSLTASASFELAGEAKNAEVVEAIEKNLKIVEAASATPTVVVAPSPPAAPQKAVPTSQGQGRQEMAPLLSRPQDSTLRRISDTMLGVSL